MKLTLHENPFEIGDCRVLAKFVGVDPYYNPESKDQKGRSIGQQLRWRFMIDAGPDRGKVASTLTPAVPGIKNNAGKMLEAISGRELFAGEEVDLSKQMGAYYFISIIRGYVAIKPAPSYVGTVRPNGEDLYSTEDNTLEGELTPLDRTEPGITDQF